MASSADGDAAASCDSCGIDGEALTPVRRTYVTIESWDTPGSSRTLDDIERWCYACRSHYPHDDAADG